MYICSLHPPTALTLACVKGTSAEPGRWLRLFDAKPAPSSLLLSLQHTSTDRVLFKRAGMPGPRGADKGHPGRLSGEQQVLRQVSI